MFAGGSVLNQAFAAMMFRRSFFRRYHPRAPGSFRHFGFSLVLKN
jgi:hypothetical protein